MKNKALITLNILAAMCCIGLGYKFLLMPVFAKAIYASEYKQLMFQCDNVMRDHMIAKNRLKHEKSSEAIRDLKASEIGLVSCHDYDKLRKTMMSWGLSSEDLSFIGLEAIEENADDLIQYVEIHEFKY